MISIFEGIEDLLKKAADFSECSRALVTFASAVGVLVLVYYSLLLTFRLVQALRLYVLSQYCCQTNFVKQYGQWAVISGATDGIGQAMAKELAGKGMSIVVIGRNDEKLAQTKSMLEQVPSVGQVETVKIDLSDSTLDNFEQIRAQIDAENRDIGVLINNAGAFIDRYARFNRFEMANIVSMVNLNVLATLHLTRMIMPSMVQRGKGLVLNVSSSLGPVPVPFLSVYGATKAFVDYFTKQLQMEYSSHPIDIVLLQPGPVSTKLLKATSTMSDSFLAPTPEAFAKTSINALSTGVSTYAGVMSHELMLSNLKLADWLNLTGPMMKFFIPFGAKNFELSPVAKRKRLVPNQTVSDGANAESESLNMNDAPK